jgi:N-acetylglucosaminyl-diphospho-decaprenol L-rhamnosyltransferase
MTTAARVTAVVVTHNSARHLAPLAHTFASGSLMPGRLLVVDNASVDDTAACAELAGFEVHKLSSNDGFGAACNVGLRATCTEFVLFCNPDVRPSPSALERLLASLMSTPAAAIAGASLEDPVQARRFSHVSADAVGFFPRRLQPFLRRFQRDLAVDEGHEQVVVDYAVGAFILCRVTALESVGGFDERFFLYCEEEDLCRRLRERGLQTLLVPSSTVAHEHGTSTEGVDKAVLAPFRFHSLYWYYRKHRSRTYAEFARCAISICVMIDRGYRALTRRVQVYGPRTAMAPFRSTGAVRRDYERRAGKRVA